MHNHITRDIKPRGECLGCDDYHDKVSQREVNDVVNKLTEREAQGALVMDAGLSADSVIANMTEDGWVLSDEVDYVAGKRIRYMTRRTDATSTEEPDSA